LSSSASVIHVSLLQKSYFVPEREAGLKAALKSLVRRKNREVKAVDHIRSCRF
jgi:ABC-2 type transport system ATP-binding protein